MPDLRTYYWPLLLAVLLCVAGTYRSAQAQETAFLLGYRYAQPIVDPLPYYAGSADSLSMPAYHSVLIVSRNGEFALGGETSGLLIPRNGEFWQVGTKRSIYNNWVEDFIWSAPEDGQAELPGIQAYNGENCDGHRTQTINFAGSDYLAVQINSAGYCEDAAHPWYFNTLAVVPIDSTTHLGVPISQLFGDAGRTALYESAASYLGGLSEDEQYVYVQEPDEASWNLVRRHGRWIVKGRLDPIDVAHTKTADFAVDTPVPSSLVRRNQIAPAWPAVRAFAPDAADAFSSPNGNMLVIQHPLRLTVHHVTNGRIQPAALILRVPSNTQPVMARWATGAAAARWAAHFAQLARPSLTQTQ